MVLGEEMIRVAQLPDFKNLAVVFSEKDAN
jgi:hypothetical protein